MYLLGSHVGMSGKDMMLGSVKDAISYGANTFMLYTGAPQNTKRKKKLQTRMLCPTKLLFRTEREKEASRQAKAKEVHHH